MKVSRKGLMALISHEGIVLSRYKDSKGVWTIGVGHTKAAGGLNPEKFTGTLSITQVMDMFAEDIAKYEADVNKALKVNVTQHQFDALVSFHYNTGAIARATLTKTLNTGDKATAAKQFMNWVKPPEIKKRREAEMNLFKNGVYPAPTAMAYSASSSGAVQWGKGKKVNLEELLPAKEEYVADYDKMVEVAIDAIEKGKETIGTINVTPGKSEYNTGSVTIMSLLAKFFGKLFGIK